ncbi:MAG: DUF1592 domain-containing protein [Opitutaceae bacterium]
MRQSHPTRSRVQQAIAKVAVGLCAAAWPGAAIAAAPLPGTAAFIEQHCAACHDETEKKGELDLTALKFEPTNADNFATWVKVFDRASSGEMPPKKKPRPASADLAAFTHAVAAPLLAHEQERAAREGRATRRRLNREEYENALRDLLHAPWLEIKDRLPEDAVAHNYNKIGDALEMTHVQVARYLDAADYALRQVIAHQAERPATTVTRYYARDQKTFQSNIAKYRNEQERMVIPVLDVKAQYEIYEKKAPITVGAADPATREREAFVEIASQYESYEMWFDAFTVPRAGRYKLRFNTFTAWVGPEKPEQAAPGKGHRWWIPDLRDVSIGRRTEPVTIYAETIPHNLRVIGKFDAQIEPTVHELDVWLVAGETIRLDLTRLFRSRQGAGRFRNPLATEEGAPGVGFRWLEVEGPLLDAWPTAGHRLLFGDLPLKQNDHPALDDFPLDVVSTDPRRDAARLLRHFLAQAYRRPTTEADVQRFLPVVENVLRAGDPFVEAMISGFTSVLCSPDFVGLEEKPGALDDHALAARLSFFLQNTAPDAELRALAAAGKLRQPAVLRAQTDRLLDSPKSAQFVNAFLDYWLDLRTMSGAAPDPILYGDYYLDDLLNDSAPEETRAFFTELVRRDLPTRNIVDSDFAMLNERLAKHYGLPLFEGVAMRRVPLPAASVRGGLLTQASILKVTANGTSTSPVKRGAWILDRILGRPPSPPPPNTPVVEPDTRGAKTIREQLDQHRDVASCAFCHRAIDPPGFALESFDVMGGWRDRYRATAENAAAAHEGIAYGGQKLLFRFAQPVDATGEMADGRKFSDVREFKRFLLEDEAQLARNLTQQLAVYATGAPVGFADRAAIEGILARTRAGGYGVRSLVRELVQSELFLKK